MRVLAVGAHPDDLELLCGGTLAKYAQQGHHVTMAVATNGEVGSMTLPKEEIAAVRKAEAEAAATVIGADFVWMGYPDEFLFSREDTRLAFLNLMRRARPDVVIAPAPTDYHPDHPHHRGNLRGYPRDDHGSEHQDRISDMREHPRDLLHGHDRGYQFSAGALCGHQRVL